MGIHVRVTTLETQVRLAVFQGRLHSGPPDGVNKKGPERLDGNGANGCGYSASPVSSPAGEEIRDTAASEESTHGACIVHTPAISLHTINVAHLTYLD